MDKKTMSEWDICTKFITPVIAQAGRDIQKQVREEFSFTKGCIMVRGKARRADFILYHQLNLALAVIEAKVDELTHLCEALKGQLASARQQHEEIAHVLTERALA